MSMLTPPAALPPGALQTPDAAQIIYLVRTLHPTTIRNHNFGMDYAELHDKAELQN